MAIVEMVKRAPLEDMLLTAVEVAARLSVSKDWVWDHSSRKAPYLPVIRMGEEPCAIVPARLRSSSTRGSDSPLCAASAAKMKNSPLVPPTETEE
jgi:hypothetical protein